MRKLQPEENQTVNQAPQLSSTALLQLIILIYIPVHDIKDQKTREEIFKMTLATNPHIDQSVSMPYVPPNIPYENTNLSNSKDTLSLYSERDTVTASELSSFDGYGLTKTF